jgi:predicted outer membrane repeat protein
MIHVRCCCCPITMWRKIIIILILSMIMSIMMMIVEAADVLIMTDTTRYDPLAPPPKRQRQVTTLLSSSFVIPTPPNHHHEDDNEGRTQPQQKQPKQHQKEKDDDDNDDDNFSRNKRNNNNNNNNNNKKVLLSSSSSSSFVSSSSYRFLQPPQSYQIQPNNTFCIYNESQFHTAINRIPRTTRIDLCHPIITISSPLTLINRRMVIQCNLFYPNTTTTQMYGCILDAQMNNRHVTITSKSIMTFRGITFLNGNSLEDGGAMFIDQGSNVMYDACQFQYNTANDRGGAIYIQGQSNVTFDNTIDSTIIMEMYENQCNTYGGFLYITNQSNVTFHGNYANYQIMNNRINVGFGYDAAGGAIYLHEQSHLFMIQTNDIGFDSNRVEVEYVGLLGFFYGGAIYCEQSHIIMTNTILRSNFATVCLISHSMGKRRRRKRTNDERTTSCRSIHRYRSMEREVSSLCFGFFF